MVEIGFKKRKYLNSELRLKKAKEIYNFLEDNDDISEVYYLGRYWRKVDVDISNFKSIISGKKYNTDSYNIYIPVNTIQYTLGFMLSLPKNKYLITLSKLLDKIEKIGEKLKFDYILLEENKGGLMRDGKLYLSSSVKEKIYQGFKDKGFIYKEGERIMVKYLRDEKKEE